MKDEYKILAYRLRASYAITLRMTRQELEKRSREENITISPHAVAVIRLAAHEPKTIGELSSLMMIAPASLVPVVDMLVNKGLLKKDTDPKDRRRNPLTATAKGIDILQKFKMISSADVLVKNLEKLGIDKANRLAAISEELLCLMSGNEEVCKTIHNMAEREASTIKK